MELLVFKTEKELDSFIGKYIVDFIHQHDQPHLGFATGSTPLGIYQYLIDEYKKGNVDFSSVKAFNLDEYVGLEKSHPRSFAYAMKKTYSNILILNQKMFILLMEKLKIWKKNV